MAKLTDVDKNEILDNLIANEGSEESGPWTEDDRELLGNMSDERLIALDEAREAANDCQMAANAARTGFRDEAGNSHVFNEETGVFESRIRKQKEIPPIINPKLEPMTEDEWFKAAPASVQSVVNAAIKAQEDQKKQLIGQILVNSRGMDKERVKKITQNLWENDIDDLQDMLSLMPKQQQASSPSRFVGASPAPVVVNAQDDYDKDDYLPLPTVNWVEEAKLQRQA